MIRKVYLRERFAPLDDIGVLWVIVLSLYTILPILSWVIQGGVYISILTPRLLSLQPSTSMVIDLLTMSLFLLIGFLIIYYPFRKKAIEVNNFSIGRIPIHIFKFCLMIFLFVKLITIILYKSTSIGSAETYIDQYRVILEAPLVIRQLLKYLLSLHFFSFLVCLIFIFQNWKKYKWIFFLFLFVTIINFDPKGGRAAIAIMIFASFVLWHILQKRISFKYSVILGISALFIFLAFGIFREINNIGDYDLTGEDNPGMGEFDAIWTNAVELYTFKISDPNFQVPFTIRFSELWEFIPSQLLPFQKKSLSNWYVEEFYPEYKELGGGFAFGVLSQLAIGGGVIEGLIRGIIFGFLLGSLFLWYRKNIDKWYVLPSYMSIYLYIFMSIRDTLFNQVSNIIQNMIPIMFLLILYDNIYKSKKIISVDENISLHSKYAWWRRRKTIM